MPQTAAGLAQRSS